MTPEEHIEYVKKKMCGNKIYYPNEVEANRAVVRLVNHKSNHNLTAYDCKFCSGWHIGHNRFKKKSGNR